MTKNKLIPYKTINNYDLNKDKLMIVYMEYITENNNNYNIHNFL